MNRIVLATLSLSALTACGVGTTGEFQHSSSLATESRGVAIYEDGRAAHIGMSGSTCDINVTTGMIGSDYDYAGSDEVVADAGIVNGVPSTLILSDDGLHIQEISTWDIPAADPLSGVIDATLIGDGTVALSSDGSCDVTWSDGASITVSPSACDTGSISADDRTGSAFISDDNGLSIVTPEGVQALGIHGDLFAWDSAAEVLYVAESGGITVHGVEIDGSVLWSTEIQGIVTAVDTLGDQGAALIAAQTFSSGGLILELDGLTGELLAETNTPSSAANITASADGNTIAVANRGMVHFLRRR
jgi:hypothetical protein